MKMMSNHAHLEKIDEEETTMGLMMTAALADPNQIDDQIREIWMMSRIFVVLLVVRILLGTAVHLMMTDRATRIVIETATETEIGTATDVVHLEIMTAMMNPHEDHGEKTMIATMSPVVTNQMVVTRDDDMMIMMNLATDMDAVQIPDQRLGIGRIRMTTLETTALAVATEIETGIETEIVMMIEDIEVTVETTPDDQHTTHVVPSVRSDVIEITIGIDVTMITILEIALVQERSTATSWTKSKWMTFPSTSNKARNITRPLSLSWTICLQCISRSTKE